MYPASNFHLCLSGSVMRDVGYQMLMLRDFRWVCAFGVGVRATAVQGRSGDRSAKVLAGDPKS